MCSVRWKNRNAQYCTGKHYSMSSQISSFLKRSFRDSCRSLFLPFRVIISLSSLHIFAVSLLFFLVYIYIFKISLPSIYHKRNLLASLLVGSHALQLQIFNFLHHALCVLFLMLLLLTLTALLIRQLKMTFVNVSSSSVGHVARLVTDNQSHVTCILIVILTTL